MSLASELGVSFAYPAALGNFFLRWLRVARPKAGHVGNLVDSGGDGLVKIRSGFDMHSYSQNGKFGFLDNQRQ
jgi:hypothetical protein